MPRFKITERVVTYCEVTVEAENAEAARALAQNPQPFDLDWKYETDYDTSLGIEVTPVD